MALGVTGMSAGEVVRKRIYLALGVAMVAAAITLAFLSMRSVMEIGGSCASGGPYEIARQCPSNSWLLFVAFPLGFVGVGLMALGRLPGGASLTLLAWPALFLSLGWNFLSFAFAPPPPEKAPVAGWLICGVMFVVMGGVPLVYVVSNRRQFFWGGGAAPDPDADRAAATAELAGALDGLVRALRRPPGPAPAPPSPWTMPLPGPPPGSTDPDDDLTSTLERLAALHAAGHLDDDEYAAAKTQVLGGDR